MSPFFPARGDIASNRKHEVVFVYIWTLSVLKVDVGFRLKYFDTVSRPIDHHGGMLA